MHSSVVERLHSIHEAQGSVLGTTYTRVVVCATNPNNFKMESEGCSWLHFHLETSLGYRVRCNVKKN